MQFSLLALSALAASVSAQQSSPDLVSIISVLQTGLPSSLLQEALTNSAALSSEIASQFRVATPTWFTALPTDIQTYLVAAANTPTVLANATAGIATLNGTAITNSTSVAAAQSSISSANSAQISSQLESASAAGTTSSAGSGAASATSAAGSSSSAAGASMPTALYGMGLAGAVGLVGVLAL